MFHCAQAASAFDANSYAATVKIQYLQNNKQQLDCYAVTKTLQEMEKKIVPDSSFNICFLKGMNPESKTV